MNAALTAVVIPAALTTDFARRAKHALWASVSIALIAPERLAGPRMAAAARARWELVPAERVRQGNV